jgi:UDP-N-acetylglucosamine acyltransferase
MSARIEWLNRGVAGSDDRQQIDPRAVISPRAVVGPGCTIGAFAVIGDDVELGPACVVHPHAVLSGPARLGPKNEVHAFSCIGGSPQDLRYKGEATELVIGEGNVFREHMTVNRGTVHGGGETLIGDRNLFMAYSHIAHDCLVGSHVVMANHATVAGHTVIEDHVVFGGMVGVGTFLRIGESAMLAAGAMVEREVAPFCIVSGDRARLRAVNRVGLDRRGTSQEAKLQIKGIFRMLKETNLTLSEIVDQCRPKQGAGAPWPEKVGHLTPEADRMVTFLASVKRGLTR